MVVFFLKGNVFKWLFRHSGFKLLLWRAGILWWTQERCLATVSHWMTSLCFLGEETDSCIQDGLVHGFETSMEPPVHDGLMKAHGWSWIRPFSGHFGELILASTFLFFLHLYLSGGILITYLRVNNASLWTRISFLPKNSDPVDSVSFFKRLPFTEVWSFCAFKTANKFFVFLFLTQCGVQTVTLW